VLDVVDVCWTSRAHLVPMILVGTTAGRGIDDGVGVESRAKLRVLRPGAAVWTTRRVIQEPLGSGRRYGISHAQAQAEGTPAATNENRDHFFQLHLAQHVRQLDRGRRIAARH